MIEGWEFAVAAVDGPAISTVRLRRAGTETGTQPAEESSGEAVLDTARR